MNLYKVTLRGFYGSIDRMSYVVATDSGCAYKIVRDYLDSKSLGFRDDRAMKSVELLAEETPCPECGSSLYIDRGVYKTAQ